MHTLISRRCQNESRIGFSNTAQGKFYVPLLSLSKLAKLQKLVNDLLRKNIAIATKLLGKQGM